MMKTLRISFVFAGFPFNGIISTGQQFALCIRQGPGIVIMDNLRWSPAYTLL